MAETTPKAVDLLSVRSRISWGAIAAGAMVALAVYFVLTLMGVAVGIEAAVRGTDVNLGIVAGIYTLITLLLAMFFGGWTVSRLAVGETRTEAVLYGIILWGVLFVGLFWLVGQGMRTGFGAMLGLASGAYESSEGDDRASSWRSVKVESAELKKAGLDEEQARKVEAYVARMQAQPLDTVRETATDADVQSYTRQATWWSLLGVVVSMAAVVFGSLVGAGEVLQPVPILGVRRSRDPRSDPNV